MNDDFLTIYLKGLEDGKEKKKQEIEMLEAKLNKQKEVLDKIKELMNTTPDTNYCYDYVILKNEIYKLLEEIE